MNRLGPRLLLAPLVASLLLAGWAIFSAADIEAGRFNLAIYALANLIIFGDALDFAMRLYFRRLNATAGDSRVRREVSVSLESKTLPTLQKRVHLRPYAIVVSVHNIEARLEDFTEAMQPHRDRVWVIDDGSTDQTIQRLRQAGWRCLDGQLNRKKPGAIRALLDSLPPEIESVMVIDPDIRIRGRRSGGRAELEEVIFDFQRSGMAALCPRIAISADGFLARFQSLEYSMAFALGRRSLADHSITSGISLYRRADLASVLKQHSLSVYAEDLENTLILLGSGQRVYYDGRLVVDTAGMESWRKWFSQRVGWYFGLIKVYHERLDELQRAGARRLVAAYQFFLYTGVFTLLLHPLKLVGSVLLLVSLANGLDGLLGLEVIPDRALTNPVYALAACAKYLLLGLAAFCTVVPARDRAYVLPIVPLYFFYALAQVAPASVGYANWFALRLSGRRLYRDHYQDEASLQRQHRSPLLSANKT